MPTSSGSSTTPRLLTALWQTALGWGVFAVVLGALMVWWPGATILVGAVLLGLYLIVSGVAQVAAAFGADESAGARVLFFITGVVSVVLGILAFRNFGDGYAVLLLGIWIGVGFIFQGVSETAVGMNYRDLPGRGWQIFLGTLTILAGLVILAWPMSTIGVLVVVTGIWLIVIGVVQIVKALKMRRGIQDLEHSR